jgi:hypothetical protein
MRNIFISLIFIFLVSWAPDFVYSQANTNTASQITSSDMKSYVTFLASPLLKGRQNGEAGLEIAALYIASQAKLAGLKPADGNSYFQSYSVMKKVRNPKFPPMQLILKNKDTIIINEPRYELVPTDPSFILPEGSVVNELKNVAGYIEGSDSILKNEVIVFSCHYDHIGTSGSRVNPGADDDASGCAALLSIAKAFQSLEKKPLRSILFLWLSGEEIGLFGSEAYIREPLFPLEKTIADLNIDMIGRDKESVDSTSDTPMTGLNSVFVITDNQSKELSEIANEVDSGSVLNFDYSLSGRYHPLHLFARSDHYNFVKKDIPILCFTTGIHSDYHTSGDVFNKLDFKKMELIARTAYQIGLTIANRETRLIIDNPFSSWEKNK